MSVIVGKLKEWAVGISQIVRGSRGLAPEESKYQYLIDVEDIRERTALEERDVYGHSLMQIAAKQYEELAIWGKIADQEDHYFISKEGGGRNLAALLQIGKREQTEAGTIAIQLPEVRTQPTEEKEGKKNKPQK